MEDDDYEAQRLANIAENRRLLLSLGLELPDPSGSTPNASVSTEKELTEEQLEVKRKNREYRIMKKAADYSIPPRSTRSKGIDDEPAPEFDANGMKLEVKKLQIDATRDRSKDFHSPYQPRYPLPVVEGPLLPTTWSIKDSFRNRKTKEIKAREVMGRAVRVDELKALIEAATKSESPTTKLEESTIAVASTSTLLGESSTAAALPSLDDFTSELQYWHSEISTFEARRLHALQSHTLHPSTTLSLEESVKEWAKIDLEVEDAKQREARREKDRIRRAKNRVGMGRVVKGLGGKRKNPAKTGKKFGTTASTDGMDGEKSEEFGEEMDGILEDGGSHGDEHFTDEDDYQPSGETPHQPPHLKRIQQQHLISSIGGESAANSPVGSSTLSEMSDLS